MGPKLTRSYPYNIRPGKHDLHNLYTTYDFFEEKPIVMGSKTMFFSTSRILTKIKSEKNLKFFKKLAYLCRMVASISLSIFSLPVYLMSFHWYFRFEPVFLLRYVRLYFWYLIFARLAWSYRPGEKFEK